MSTTAECQSEFQSEINTFEGVVYFSLGLTVCSFLATLFLKPHFLATPSHGWKFFWTLSAIKLLLGILLFTAFTPTCPSGCNCGSYHPSYVYPSIVLVVGVLWALRGKKYYDLGNQGIEGHENGIPGTEMKTSATEII
jgi:hypothetical protein